VMRTLRSRSVLPPPFVEWRPLFRHSVLPVRQRVAARLRLKESLNPTDQEGVTALMLAARRGFVQVIQGIMVRRQLSPYTQAMGPARSWVCARPIDSKA
jgi:hypothetical protein